MKKILCLLLTLCLSLSLLAGCESGLNEDPQETTEPSSPGSALETTVPEVQNSAERQIFYDYLKNVHIPEVGLANLTSTPWKHCSELDGVEYNATHMIEIGCGGLLSAVVRDFDLDGDLDMVTFYMNAQPHNEIWPAIYSGGTKTPAHVISMSYFTLEDGQVVLKDSYPHVIKLDGASWGPIQIYMEQLEDGIYIHSFSDATDYSTYGASPSTIFHIADDKIVFDYISGIKYGQSSLAENPNHLMNTTNLNPNDYTFGTLTKSADKVDPNGDEENRWIYWGTLAEPGSNGMTSYTGVDFTGLRIILEQGLDAFPYEPLPQGGKKPANPVAEEGMAAAQIIADYVAVQSGCVFVYSSSLYRESSNSATITFETEEYTHLYFTYEGNTGIISGFTLTSNDYPIPSEWHTMKDALLQYPQFGLLAEEIAPFLGKFKNFSDYMGGYAITGATIRAMQITDTYLRVDFE